MMPSPHNPFQSSSTLPTWTVLQRRSGPSLSFWNQTFVAYSYGFGDPSKDHWLGLERVYSLQQATNKSLQMKIEIRGDLCENRRRGCSNNPNGYWWGIWNFTISTRLDGYRISNLIVISGNLSDPSAPENDPFRQMNNNQKFTTVDVDNDQNPYGNCAQYREYGAWWMKDCTLVALNGAYGSQNGKSEQQFWYYISHASGISQERHFIKPHNSQISFRTV